jgi:hypothetical protein
VDEGVLLDGFCYFLQELGVGDRLGHVQGTAVQHEMVPFVQYLLLYNLKTLFGTERINALPALLFSDDTLMRLVGFNAQQVRHGVCHRGDAKRSGPRIRGPICSDTVADNVVKLKVRDLEALFNGVIPALAEAWILRAKMTGMVDG